MEQNSPVTAGPFSVVIIGFDQALASSISGAIDMFSLAGVAMQRINQQPVKKLFNVQIASLDGGMVRCINNNVLMAHSALEDIEHADIVMIPTIGGNILQVLEQTRGILPHLIRLYRAGCDIASNCTGTFLLANAGLLNNRLATTHWGYSAQFQQLFPKVQLREELLITEDPPFFCAGGGMAWFDLVLRIIERYTDHTTAADTAKAHVIEFARGQQAAYAPLQRKKFHHDNEISQLQDWLDNHYAQPLTIDVMAAQVSLSPRTLNRRFKRATQQTPQQYLQSIRLENAKRLLVSTQTPISQIVQQIGYDDLSSFTRLFKRITGFSPGYYRASFRR
ncbi:GlxA family transcriptional regulator [Alteromonas flava]|uniref:GlxA family transcriptional regulator n=1 Tax=Alteromonas flava TaxID=2048003 RepID=UPI000C293E9B|nr:helix-turn-helix domain-containing protein [Alteromonas flava]